MKNLLNQTVMIGTMISEIRTPAIIRMLEAAELDFVIIDEEHGCYDFTSLGAMAAVAAGQRIACLARIPQICREAIMKPLDLGCDGIVVPQVETVEQVQEVIKYAKYKPIGERGVALRRGHSGYHKNPAAEYLVQANQSTIICVQIESPKSIENLENILDVPGVDIAFVGPFDLSVAMGLPGQIDHPEVIANVQKVIEACNKRGIIAGIMQFNLDNAKEYIRRGIRFMVYSSDINMIIDQAEYTTRELKKVKVV